ncbi:hypothetical protein DFQ27_001680, partial [Actinomortierella ambigua]
MLIDTPPSDHVTRASYASKVKIQHIPFAKREATWQSIRANTVTRYTDTTPKERFIWGSQQGKTLAGIRYPKDSVFPTQILELLKANFAIRAWECTVPGLIYINFATNEDFTRATTEPIAGLPASLQPLPVRYSVRKRINIRAQNVPICPEEEDTLNALQALFGPAGEILDLQRHLLMGIPTANVDFTLELSDSAAENADLLLPRVAPIERRNVLFAWNAVRFCYRCGSPDHDKATCSKPSDYCLGEAQSVPSTIWGRAFPPTTNRSPPQSARPSPRAEMSSQGDNTPWEQQKSRRGRPLGSKNKGKEKATETAPSNKRAQPNKEKPPGNGTPRAQAPTKSDTPQPMAPRPPAS